MSTVVQLLVGVLAGGLLAALSVGGLFAALRPWARGQTHTATLAGSTLLRLALVGLGLGALLTLGRPAFLGGALALVVIRPLLVRWLAPRLADPSRETAP